MTLVIAQKFNNLISLSSDSRISFSVTQRIDYGIKVFSIPVKIHSPISHESNHSTLDYNHYLGLAVIGSVPRVWPTPLMSDAPIFSPHSLSECGSEVRLGVRPNQINPQRSTNRPFPVPCFDAPKTCMGVLPTISCRTPGSR